MIQDITLTNFQSWETGTLHFSPGINAIIGESDNGKSAIMRALHWVVENKPAAASFCSFWNKDKEGNQTNEIEVTLGVDGTIISRRKTTDQNAYMVGRDIYEAVGRDVPEQVKTALNISTVNVQKQLDAPFLISGSAGEIARFFNEIIKLDEIDACLASADSYKRETNSALKEAENRQTILENSIKNYAFLDEALSQAAKCANIEERLTDTKEQCEKAEKLLKDREMLTTELDKFGFLGAAQMVAKATEKIQADLDIAIDKAQVLENMLYITKTISTNIKELPDLTGASNKIKAAETLNEEFKAIDLKERQINGLGKEIVAAKAELKTLMQSLAVLEKQIPDTCPVCNQIIKKELI